MDWNDLRFFLAVARTGSLAGAARRLRVNHSTVFRRLNGFEQRLDVRLFERLPQGYLLTEAGERLVPRAERVEAEFDGLGRDILGMDERLSGEVRVTSAPNLALNYLAPILASFSERYPQVVVELVVTAENRDLTRREADLALRATSRAPDHLAGRRAVSIPWWVCAGSAWLSQHDAPVTSSDLARLPFIGAADALARLPAFEWARRHVPSHHVVARCDDLDAVAALAVAGMGLTLLPQDQVKPGLVQLFPLNPSTISDLWLLTHPDLRSVRRIGVLMETIVASLRADPRLASREASAG